MSAAFVPSTFATSIVFTFATFSAATSIAVVLDVPSNKAVELTALIVATFTIFGVAILFSFYPNTIAIAIAFPVVAALEFASTYVINLEAATFLLVPPAPLSTINKSASTIASPISVAPSMSNAVKGAVPALILAPESTGVCENVTTPFDAIAIASVSEADPMFPASGITTLPPVVRTPPPVIVPAKVTFAPLNVAAVVVPDLIIKFPLVFVALPKVVPPSLKNISPPSASKVISVVASSVIVEPESISAITGVVKVLFVNVCVAAIPAIVSV